MSRLLFLGSVGGPTALASAAGVLAALELRPEVTLAGVSGVSGSAGVAAAMACRVSYATIEKLLGRISYGRIFGPAIPNLTRWVASGLKSYMTGIFRAKPYRDYLKLVLGNLTLADVQVPLEIPVLHVESGRVVSYAGGPGIAAGDPVSLVSLARASSAIPGVFEAESEFDPRFPRDHFVDPGLTAPINHALLRTVSYDRVLVLVADATKVPGIPNLRALDYSYFRLLFQALASAYTENMQRTVLAVLRAFPEAQILRAPKGVDFWNFTGADMVAAAQATRAKALTFLDDPTLSDSVTDASAR